MGTIKYARSNVHITGRNPEAVLEALGDYAAATDDRELLNQLLLHEEEGCPLFRKTTSLPDTCSKLNISFWEDGTVVVSCHPGDLAESDSLENFARVIDNLAGGFE